MAEQIDNTFREVISQMSQANLVTLLPWFLMHPRVDTPMDNTTWNLGGTTA